jgi:hypothetical protein
MSLPICERTPRHRRDAHTATRNIHAAVTRAFRNVGPAIREGCEIALMLAGPLAVMAAGLALDAWIWIPRSGH